VSWFKRKVKPSRPSETFLPQRIDFVGEQAGPADDDLKKRFCEVFVHTPTVQSAYLARLSYGDSPGYSVGLCIRSSVGLDEPLEKRLAQVFAEVFRSEEHLDIMFIRGDQEKALKKVCSPFYESA